ncbi:MAG: class II glutamine amidotransferase, partial [Bacteroidales bacterium]|nr:class II glutamine amidotransferase [Bacteroidales bacterium]
MCGIVAYVGNREAYPILIKGLHRLEYRGYDSAGVCVFNNDALHLYKTLGKVSDLERFVEGKDMSGHIGIAHTRWATHGLPNEINAHPHYSQYADIALIHNGIIENYATLKEELKKHGRSFTSETDTEVLVQLIDFIRMDNGISLEEAVHQALSQVVGAYAIAIMSKDDPYTIIGARKGSPLVIGVGEGEFILASDATPLVEYTKKVIYLDEEEIAVMTVRPDAAPQLRVTNLKNVRKTPLVQTLETNLEVLEKGGYPHFMLKEIYEQPKVIRDSFRGRINVERNTVALSGIIDHQKEFLSARRIIIT